MRSQWVIRTREGLCMMSCLKNIVAISAGALILAIMTSIVPLKEKYDFLARFRQKTKSTTEDLVLNNGQYSDCKKVLRKPVQQIESNHGFILSEKGVFQSKKSRCLIPRCLGVQLEHSSSSNSKASVRKYVCIAIYREIAAIVNIQSSARQVPNTLFV